MKQIETDLITAKIDLAQTKGQLDEFQYKRIEYKHKMRQIESKIQGVAEEQNKPVEKSSRMRSSSFSKSSVFSSILRRSNSNKHKRKDSKAKEGLG